MRRKNTIIYEDKKRNLLTLDDKLFKRISIVM